MAVEGGVAAFDAVFDKGKLGGGKFLTVAGLVFGQVQPLPQPQLQNQIVSRLPLLQPFLMSILLSLP